MWSGDEIATRLRKTMRAAMERVLSAAESSGTDWRTAAQVLAIQRVAEASRLRSIYP
jgi:glutamate dehydrogenase (NAD(P)+)